MEMKMNGKQMFEEIMLARKCLNLSYETKISVLFFVSPSSDLMLKECQEEERLRN